MLPVSSCVTYNVYKIVAFSCKIKAFRSVFSTSIGSAIMHQESFNCLDSLSHYSPYRTQLS